MILPLAKTPHQHLRCPLLVITLTSIATAVFELLIKRTVPECSQNPEIVLSVSFSGDLYNTHPATDLPLEIAEMIVVHLTYNTGDVFHFGQGR